MRGVVKLLLAVALAVLLATGAAACGGDDSDDPTAVTTEQTAPPATTEDDGSGQGEKEPGDDRGGSPAGSEDSDSDDSQQGSASFRTPGGDNSIQNYGEEADEEERKAASATVLGLMQARAVGDWEIVCGYLAEAALRPLEQLGERTPQFKGKSCAELLGALTASAPASLRASNLEGNIDSLRVKGDRAFALYHGTDGKDYFFPLVKEDDEWKAGTLTPSEFPG
jgi:hypothetical protein